MNDPLLRLLADLPAADPDRARGERVRARCHAALARGLPAPRPRTGAGPRLRRALLASLAAAYLMETVRQSLSLLNLG